MSISNKIAKLCEYDDYVLFKSTCSCLSNDHDLMISVEMEEDNGHDSLVLGFSANVSFIDNGPAFQESIIEKIDRNIRNIFYKIRKSLKLLFTGYLEMDTYFLIDKSEDIEDFLEAINYGLKKFKKDNKNKE